MVNKIYFILSNYKKRLLILLIVFFISSLLELIGIGIIFPYVNIINNPESIHEYALYEYIQILFNINSYQQLVLILSCSLILIYIVKNVIIFISQYTVNYFIYNLLQNLRHRLYSAYLHAPFEFHLNKNSATLISNINNEAQKFTLSITRAMLSFASEALFLVMVLSTALYAFPKLIIVVLFLSVFIYFFYLFSRKKTYIYGKADTDSHALLLKLISEGLLNFKIARIHGAENFLISRSLDVSRKITNAASKFFAFTLIPKLSMEIILITVFSGFVCYQTFFASSSGLAIPILATFAVGAVKFIPSANKVISSLTTIKHGEATIDTIFNDLIEIEQKCKSDFSKTAPGLVYKSKIDIANIDFQYENREDLALKDIKVIVEKGQSIGIVGPSGSGKSTLINVILGLLRPLKGDIRLDNQSIYKNIRSWYETLAYVPQMIQLADDSLRNNIAFGINEEEIDNKLLADVIRVSNLSAVIDQLPNGIDTILGENGSRLSGGQRQRVAIARALYKQPGILILDEATSSLDSETEGVITEAIESLSGKITIIIVAHRLTTIKKCDTIYQMSKGRIINSGDFQSIIDLKNP